MAKTNCIFENVRREMGGMNMSQKDLATAIGISEKSIGLKLSGRREFTRKELFAIADVFGKSVDYLFAK